MTNDQLFSRRLLLRASLKTLTTIAALWVFYILTAGFFPDAEKSKAVKHEFNVSSLAKDKAIYLKIDKRELLVIHSQKGYLIFWAQDPIYGCRLEFLNSIIKPVCIDIEYDLKGYNISKNQQLKSPVHKINLQGELVIY